MIAITVVKMIFVGNNDCNNSGKEIHLRENACLVGAYHISILL